MLLFLVGVLKLTEVIKGQGTGSKTIKASINSLHFHDHEPVSYSWGRNKQTNAPTKNQKGLQRGGPREPGIEEEGSGQPIQLFRGGRGGARAAPGAALLSPAERARSGCVTSLSVHAPRTHSAASSRCRNGLRCHPYSCEGEISCPCG